MLFIIIRDVCPFVKGWTDDKQDVFLCMIHDPSVIRIYTIILTTNAFKYIKTESYVFRQATNDLEGYKIQILDTLKI